MSATIGAVPACDRGILFVHGIGEQLRADTLLQCADPFIGWLQRWLERKDEDGHPVGSLRITRSRVSPEDSSDTPAHVILELTLNSKTGGNPRIERWLLAEGRWAEEARTPAFSQLASWMLTTGTWIVLSHGLTSARDMFQTSVRSLRSAFVELQITRSADIDPRALLQFPSTLWNASRVPFEAAQLVLLSIALACALQIVLLVLLALSVIPIPQLRAALSNALLRISGIIGDAYVLLESAVQHQAIIGAVRRNLEWVAGRCGAVAVIAHSQGAAVSHEVLRSPEPDNVKLFITYGSGLAKLEELRYMNSVHREMLQYAKYAVPLTVLATIVAVRVSSVYGSEPWARMSLGWCLVPISMLVSIFVFALRPPRAMRERAADLRLDTCRPHLEWFDLFASADPVANGVLTFAGEPVQGVDSTAVVNRRSLLSDHTTYWENGTQFIPAIFRRLDAAFACGLVDGPATAQLDRAAAARWWRVNWLVWMRWNAMIATVLIAIAWGSQLPELGRTVTETLLIPPISAVGTLVVTTGRTAVRACEWLNGDEFGSWTQIGYGVMGFATIALVVALLYRVFFAAWRAWEQLYVSALFDVRETKRSWRAIAGVAVIGVGLIPLVAGAAMVVTPALELVAREPVEFTERRAYQFLGMVFVGLYWVVAFAATLVAGREIVNANDTGERLRLVAAIAVLIAIGAWTTGFIPGNVLGQLAAILTCGAMAVQAGQRLAHEIKPASWLMKWFARSAPAAATVAASIVALARLDLAGADSNDLILGVFVVTIAICGLCAAIGKLVATVLAARTDRAANKQPPVERV